MNEEISKPGTAIELDTDILKATLVDSTLNNAEYDIKTEYVTRMVNGERMIAWAEAETTTETTETETTNTTEENMEE